MVCFPACLAFQFWDCHHPNVEGHAFVLNGCTAKLHLHEELGVGGKLQRIQGWLHRLLLAALGFAINFIEHTLKDGYEKISVTH